MAKDPAVLFYTSDFLSGTSFFTDEQRGQYITLLCQQHQLGAIPENHMIFICKSYDSPVIKKFVKNERGDFYNVRMKEEAEKRANYCESRSKNKKGRFKEKSYDSSYENHMMGHMENENDNDNDITSNTSNTTKSKIKKYIYKKPTIEEVVAYCKQENLLIDGEHFWHYYEQTNWIKANGQKVINWKSTCKVWDRRNIATSQKEGKNGKVVWNDLV